MIDGTRTNVIVNLIRTVVLTLLSFITFPWVCRALGDSALGTYTWATTFVAYFLIIAKIGIPNLAVRECVKVRDNKELLSNKVQTFFILQGIATIGSFILMTIIVMSVPALRETNSIIFLLSINFISGAFSFEWVYTALEKQFYLAVRSVAVLTICSILTIVFVTNPGDVYIYALISSGTTVLSVIANCFFLRKYVSFKKTMPYNFKQYYREMLILFSISLTLSLYQQTDTFILGLIDDTKGQVGSYSVGYKGISIITGIISNLSVVFIPRAAYTYQQKDKQYFKNLNKYSINIALFIIVPAMITMSILAIPICALISGNYDLGTSASTSYTDSYLVLIILAMMMLTYSLGEIIYGQILLPMNKEKYYLFALLAGFVLNVVLSVVLGIFVFPDHPAIGIAIATAVTDLLVCIFLVAFTWKWVKEAIFNKNTGKILFAGVLIVISSLLLYYLVWPNVLSSLSAAWQFALEIILTVLIDGIIYIGVLLLLKEDLVYSFVRHRKNPQTSENQ